jgi:PEP-CTERM motif
MSSPALLRRAVYMLAAVAFCILFLPRPAAADNTDIVSVTFSGTSCMVSGSTCTGSDAVSGTYSIDEDTDSVVGPWSFTTPLGTISGTGGGPPASSTTQGFPAGSNLFDFMAFSGNTAVSGVQLDFDGFDGTLITGPDTTKYLPNIAAYPPSLFENFETGETFDFLSGSASVVATPEPSSIALLGLGLFGLFILRRKRTSDRLRAAQS